MIAEIFKKTGRNKLPRNSHAIKHIYFMIILLMASFLSGFHHVSIADTRSEQNSVPVVYQLDRDGFVTLVVESPAGHRIRNLLSGAYRKAGELIELWDGRDDSGHPVKPNVYRVRGLVRGELGATYEFSFGAPGDPPWPVENGSGAWLSNHRNPVAVFADQKRIYIASTYSEGPHTIIAVDYQGKKQWGSLSNDFAGPMALANGFLYIVSEEGFRPARSSADLNKPVDIVLKRLDPESGEVVAFPDGSARKTLGDWIPEKALKGRALEGGSKDSGYTLDRSGAAVFGMAANDREIFVPVRFADRILRIDSRTGKVIGEIKVESPAGVAMQGKKLLVISGTTVHQVDIDSGNSVILVDHGLVAPVAIATGQNGRFYVSDWANEMNIKIFDAGGKFRGLIGERGGGYDRIEYNPQSLRFPRGIAVDSRERIWVAEDESSPRRISIWSQDGKLLKEIIGGLHYGGTGAFVYPDEPDRALVLGNEVELDWSNARWRILSTPWRPHNERNIIGLKHDVGISKIVSNSHGRFLIHNTHELSGTTVVSRFEKNAIVPVVAAGPVTGLLPSDFGDKGGLEPSKLYADRLWVSSRLDAAAHKLINWFFHGPRAGAIQALQSVPGGRPDNNFVWSDVNHNGDVDPDELLFFASPSGLSGNSPAWRTSIWARGLADDNLTLYFTVRNQSESEHWRLPVTRWNSAGVPVYFPERAEKIASTSMDSQAAWVDGKGNLLTIADQPGRDGNGKTEPIAMWTPQGELAWTYPSPYSGVHASHAAPKGKPGELIGILGVIGEARLNRVGEVFALNTNMGQAEFFTSDGLYIGSLFTDARMGARVLPSKPYRGMPVGDISNGGEWFGGQLFQRKETGDIYILFGREAANIAKVTGLDSIRRLPVQNISLESTSSSKTGSSQAKRLAEHVLFVKRSGNPAVSQIGLERSWPSDFTSWGYDDSHRITASWSWDNENLYIWFKSVSDPTPMRNTTKDIFQLFKPGDALLFEIDTQPTSTVGKYNPDRIRIVLSVHGNQPIAILYQYDELGGGDVRNFTSPTEDVAARVTQLKAAKIDLVRGDADYSLLASIPLKAIGLELSTGEIYRGDLGVVYADQNGIDTQLRTFWSNHKTGLTNDLAGEASINPSEWGAFELH